MTGYNQLVALPIAAKGRDGSLYLPIAGLPARQFPNPQYQTKADAPILRLLNGPVRSNNQNLSPASHQSSLPDVEVDDPLPLGHGRKKRKTPAYQLSSGRHDDSSIFEGDVKDGTQRHKILDPIYPTDEQEERNDTVSEDQSPDGGLDGTVSEIAKYKLKNRPRPASTQTCEFRKLQFLRRKAALITLFLDATSAIKSYWKDEKSLSTVNMSKTLLSKLPEVDAFEKLLPALEDVGVGDWPADKPTWRKGTDIGDDDDADAERENARGRLGIWKAKFAKRRKIREERREVIRGGWAPEGSFEFERSSKAGNVAREGAKARAALQRLANELRHILLTVKPKVAALTDQNKTPPNTSKPRKTAQRQSDAPVAEAVTAPPVEAPKSGGSELERVGSGSKDGSEGGSGSGGKKKPKKKKRSVLANQSNPHHVDNYRSTRAVTSLGDPNEPYPHHASLLFPPSMSFLSARPNGSRIRAGEDDYICSFCEYDLFYGSEKLRRAAIRRRKQEIKRKENIKNKAKNVAEGKGKLNEESEYDDDEGDEDEECEDQGYGKCSCGRALGPHGDKEHHLKPPDPDPNIPPPMPNPSTLAGVSQRQPVIDEGVSRASTPSID